MPKPYRSEELRDMAQDAPHCMVPWCNKHNEMDVILAHSNSIKDGHGMSQKSHDIPCYVCQRCHDIIDGRCDVKDWDPSDRIIMRLQATYHSILWLLSSKRLVIGKEPYAL
jgi:hypothetical protein